MRSNKCVAGLVVFCVVCAPALAAGPRPDMVTPEAEAAIQKGLAYLAARQDSRGAWAGGEGYGGGYQAAMTGLAGVAQGCHCLQPLPGHLGAQVRIVDGIQDLAHGALKGGR